MRLSCVQQMLNQTCLLNEQTLLILNDLIKVDDVWMANDIEIVAHYRLQSAIVSGSCLFSCLLSSCDSINL